MSARLDGNASYPGWWPEWLGKWAASGNTDAEYLTHVRQVGGDVPIFRPGGKNFPRDLHDEKIRELSRMFGGAAAKWEEKHYG